VEVIVTDEFEEWFLRLEARAYDDVVAAVDVLEAEGVALGYPRSSAIGGSKYALRELRIQSGGHPIRVFYAFDPNRNAVLLLGGDKTGDSRFYTTMVPEAE